MKVDLSLNQLMRYAFAGGIAILGNRLLCVDMETLLRSNPTTGQISLIIGFSMLLGSATDTSIHSLEVDLLEASRSLLSYDAVLSLHSRNS